LHFSAALYIIKAFEVVDKSPTDKIDGKEPPEEEASIGHGQVISGLNKGKLEYVS